MECLATPGETCIGNQVGVASRSHDHLALLRLEMVDDKRAW